MSPSCLALLMSRFSRKWCCGGIAGHLAVRLIESELGYPVVLSSSHSHAVLIKKQLESVLWRHWSAPFVLRSANGSLLLHFSSHKHIHCCEHGLSFLQYMLSPQHEHARITDYHLWLINTTEMTIWWCWCKTSVYHKAETCSFKQELEDWF